MAHRNEELVRQGFKAFQQGDMETLSRLFADDATWHSAGDSPVAGDFTGKDEIFANFGAVQQRVDTMEQNIHDVLANDDHAVALVKFKATSGGKQLEQNQAFVFHIDDEKVQSVWLHNFDTREADEFWSD